MIHECLCISMTRHDPCRFGDLCADIIVSESETALWSPELIIGDIMHNALANPTAKAKAIVLA